jgi:IS605 OrfB family transposase
MPIKNNLKKIIEPPDKPEYKSFYYYDYNKLHNKIFNQLGVISKNIYNIGLYSIQIFNFFKVQLYHELYLLLCKNKNLNCDEYIKNKLNEYFDLYSSLKNKIKENNSYIYKNIISHIKNENIIIKNSNYLYYINFFITKFNNDSNIYLNNQNKNLLLNNIVEIIISSIYIKNFNLVRDQILSHKSLSIIDDELITDVKNNNFIDILPKNIYKDKIINELKINLKSDQNYISCMAYSKQGENRGKLESTMVCNIFKKAFESYSSYYALLNKGIKANKPKFLNKNTKYNLSYVFSKAININENLVRVFTSKFLANNFDKIFENFICVEKYKYIEPKFLKNIKGKIKKSDNYIVNDKYIEKTNKNIIDSRYLFIKIPDKASVLDIKMIEIVFINDLIKISLIYKTNNIKNNKSKISPEESISIDLGMKNLMTIYNPSGVQKIIDGKFLSSINTFYLNKISEAQSNKNEKLFKKYQMKRMFVINNYFNKITKWMENEYSNKKLIIFGYNKEWKQNSNMGKSNNMKFNKIPYMKLINKIKTRFSELNKYILLTEESYTSKCDSLSLESLMKQENYLGKRCKRGLFISGTKKVLNADLNGAINIMRKVFDLKKIEGQYLCNPHRVKIFREV